MTFRGAIPISVLLLAAAAAARADDNEPRLKDRVVLTPPGVHSCDHLEFSRDGQTLFTFDKGDGKVRLWDVSSGRQTSSLWQDGNRVLDFAASPDGKLLATISRCGIVWIWDARTLKKIRSFEGPEYTAHLLFSPDSQTLSTVAENTLYVYRVKDGEILLERQIDRHRSEDRVRPVVSSGPTNRPLLACAMRLLDAVTGEECYRLSQTVFIRIFPVLPAITSDDKNLATACMGVITLWDRNAENKAPDLRKRLVLEYPTMVFRCLTFSPSKQILVAGYEDHPRPGLKKGGILFFDVASGKQLHKQDTGTLGVHVLAFSPDGRLLAVGEDSGGIKLWDVPAAWRKQAR